MEKVGNWTESLEIYNYLLEVDPGHKLAIRNRGNVLYRLKQYNDAARDLKKSGYLHIPWVQKLYEASLERSAKQARPPALPSPKGVLAKIGKRNTRTLPSKKPIIVSQMPGVSAKVDKPSTPPRKPERQASASVGKDPERYTAKAGKTVLSNNAKQAAPATANSPGLLAF